MGGAAKAEAQGGAARCTRETLNIADECPGFSALALTWQSFRLVRHQRAVRDLRRLGEATAGTKIGKLAATGAESLEQTLARWDGRDQWFVVVGMVGLALSFLLKIMVFSVQ